MNKNNCRQEFIKYALLNVVGMVGLSCYILADTFFIAQGLGTNGLTALNLAIPVYSFIYGSGLMLGMGGATKYTIYRAQGETQKANQMFTHTILLTFGFAVVFVVIGLVAAEKLTKLLGADEEVFEMTYIYLKVILLFAPMFLLNNVLLCYVRNDGNPRLATMAMLGGSFSNIFFDYILIFPCRLGIFGAVLATGFAPVVGMGIMASHFMKKKNGFHLERCQWHLGMVKENLLLGLPSLITEISSGVVIIVFNIILLNLSGNVGVAAYGVVANLSLVVISIFNGVAQGMQPVVSRSYGLGEQETSGRVLRYAIVTVLGLSLFVYGGLYFGASPVTALFNHEENVQLQQIAEVGLKLYFIGAPFAGVNVVLSMYFMAMERAVPAQIISLARGLVVIIPIALVLSWLWKIVGVWLTFPVTEFIVMLLGACLLRDKKKMI
ncbi:MAG: MATE family efflux transporter [Lachnospiraceae bacterium]